MAFLVFNYSTHLSVRLYPQQNGRKTESGSFFCNLTTMLHMLTLPLMKTSSKQSKRRNLHLR